MGIRRCPFHLAAEDPFRPMWIIITLTGVYIRVGPLNSVTVVPRHPTGRFALQLRHRLLQLGEIIEWVRAAQFTTVNEAHEQIAHASPVPGLVKQRVLSVKNSFIAGCSRFGARAGSMLRLAAKSLYVNGRTEGSKSTIASNGWNGTRSHNGRLARIRRSSASHPRNIVRQAPPIDHPFKQKSYQQILARKALQALQKPGNP